MRGRRRPTVLRSHLDDDALASESTCRPTRCSIAGTWHLVTCANAGLAARLTLLRFLGRSPSCWRFRCAGAGGRARRLTPSSASPPDLTGSWSVSQIGTPPGPSRRRRPLLQRHGDVRAAGTVTGGTLTDDQGTTFTVTGHLTVTSGGVVDGTLALDDGLATPTSRWTSREARLLLTKHTIVGASTILSSPGLFTFVKREPGQTFTIPANLAADWSYHELTPSNDISPLGDATWVKGTITFHELPDPTAAPRPTSYSPTAPSGRSATAIPSALAERRSAPAAQAPSPGRTPTSTRRLTTDAAGTPANRDLILGLTDDPSGRRAGPGPDVQITPSPPAGSFTQTDLAGPWRVYLQRVESERQGSTWQVGHDDVHQRRHVRRRDARGSQRHDDDAHHRLAARQRQRQRERHPRSQRRRRWPTST